VTNYTGLLDRMSIFSGGRSMYMTGIVAGGIMGMLQDVVKYVDSMRS